MKTIQLFLICLLFSFNLFAQNLGINNLDPQAALDLKGDLRLRTATLNLPQGISHNVDLITNKAVNYNFDGGSLNGAIISGFTGGVDGRLVTIFNNGTSAIQLYDEAAGSNAQNRILTGNGNPAVIFQNGTISMRYDGQKMRWTVVSSNKADGENNLNGWGINGNTGTDNTNYIGTIDDEVGLYFKAGGKYSGRLDFAHGNTSFGIGALGNSASGGGNNNVAFGQQSLGELDGNQWSFNTAIGYNAMSQATGGLHNIGIGTQSLNYNQIGLLNLAIGRQSLESNISGSNNIGIGYSALIGNQGGSFNIAIGDNAGVLYSNLDNATAIGKNAKVATNNAIILGGTGDDAVRVGIGTQNPNNNAILELNSSSKGFLPPRMNYIEREAIINPPIGLMIFNTSSKRPNYYNGRKWKNFDETDAVVSLIGSPGYGGRIAYVFNPGEPGYIPNEIHGIVYDTLSNFPQTYSWGCMGVDLPGANSEDDGFQNTLAIVQYCNEVTPASLCFNYLANGLSDWYLPASNEADNIPISRYGYYNHIWTSTEINADRAILNPGSSIQYDAGSYIYDYAPILKNRHVITPFEDYTILINIVPVRRF
jgi:hypothetical protein